MARKNFDTINTAKQETGIDTGEVYDTIERGKNTYRAQPTASPEEQAQRKASGKTQGRKGCKVARINAGFTSENFEFIKIMSRIRGETETNFINYCIEQYRIDHPEIYEAAKAVLAMSEKSEAVLAMSEKSEETEAPEAE